jgi:hypothetical protein
MMNSNREWEDKLDMLSDLPNFQTSKLLNMGTKLNLCFVASEYNNYISVSVC